MGRVTRGSISSWTFGRRWSGRSRAGKGACSRAVHRRRSTAAGGLGPGQPVEQEGGGLVLVVLLPELPQLLLEVVGRGQRLVEAQGLLQAFPLPPPGVEVFGPLDQEPTGALEDRLLFLGGLVV